MVTGLAVLPSYIVRMKDRLSKLAFRESSLIKIVATAPREKSPATASCFAELNVGFQPCESII